jgi:hypothetical protein
MNMESDGGVLSLASPTGASGWPKKLARAAIDAAQARSEADDVRLSFHESSHAVVGRWLTGEAIGGVTIVAANGYGGLCWGPRYVDRAKFCDDEVPELCSQIAQFMPGPGESRANVADIVFLHCYNRCVELVAGTQGERLFLDGEPWFAADDERQAVAYASLITSSPASAAAFIAACRIESAALLMASALIVHALAAELVQRRTMNGAEVDAVIESAVAAKALADEIERRCDWKAAVENAEAFVALNMGVQL